MRESQLSTPPDALENPFWFEKPAPVAPATPVVRSAPTARPIAHVDPATPVVRSAPTARPVAHVDPATPAARSAPTARPVAHVDPAALVARFDAVVNVAGIEIPGLGPAPAPASAPLTGGGTAEFTFRWNEAWSHELEEAQSRRPRGRSRSGPRLATLLSVAVILAVGASAWLVAHGPRDVAARGARGASSAVAPTAAAALVAPHSPATAYASRTIPQSWLHMYWKTADEYGLDWTILAAVGTIESDNGKSTMPGVSQGTNSAGAAGPAQFLSATWARYGVNVNGAAGSDPYDAADAITTMAAYLKASGAPQNWTGALYAYNHSDLYVAQVLALADRFRG